VRLFLLAAKQGYDHFYNLEYDQAIADFGESRHP